MLGQLNINYYASSTCTIINLICSMISVAVPVYAQATLQSRPTHEDPNSSEVSSQVMWWFE